MRTESLSSVSEQLGLGDHVAFFFKRNEERLSLAIPYLIDGLRNNESCVYVADENTVPAILAEFSNEGIDIEAFTSSGALRVVTKHNTYLRHGMFDPRRMIDDLDSEVKNALHQGFVGLRITAEMSWALDLPSVLGRVCEYERDLLRSWPAQMGGLCQYNETRFPRDVIETIANSHHLVVRDGEIVRHPERIQVDTLSA